MNNKDNLEDNQTKNQLEKEYQENVPSATEEEDSEETKEDKTEEAEESSSKSSKESEETSEEGEQDEVESSDRPEKYIPIAKWQDKKKEWADKEEEYEEKIEELEASKEESAEIENLESDEEVEEFAEEHDMDKETVSELVSLAAKKSGIPDDLKKDIEKVKQERLEGEAESQFQEEFKEEVLPKIKEEYPDASQKHIDKVRDKLDKLAHTKRLHQTPLSYIYANHKSDLDDALNPPNKKTAESGSMGRGEAATTPGEIYDLPSDERKEAINDMNSEEYEEYMNFVRQKEGAGITIKREGQKVDEL